MTKMTDLKTAFAETGTQLDRIILAYRRGVPLPHPETIVWYNNNTLSSFNIEGELGRDSIPDVANAVKVDVGNKVTSLGNDSFLERDNITSINIPNSVKSIGSSSFEHCISLKSITLPNNLSSIENYTFYDCAALTSITIPDSVTSIGNSAFFECSRISSITIPNSTTIIGEGAFSICKALSSITSLRTSAPTVAENTFGNSDSYYTGWNTHSDGTNVLKIPQGATGYESGAWIYPLQNPSTCGFHIEYI